jgi:glycosyltransferase involved in cell wall biosynthesis
MIKCFYQANKKLDNKYRLLIAGASKSKEYNKSIKKEIDNHNYSKYITLLGSVSKESLKDLYQNTELLIFPSPCENFAYILVEAMSMGVPIVCSNTTAMPDTCKDAAIYFNPYNSDDMTKVIYNTMDNPEEKRKLKIKSLDRASSLPFYREVTQITLNCIMKLIDE